MYVCMFVCIAIGIYQLLALVFFSTDDVCVHLCFYAYSYVCMYVCMYAVCTCSSEKDIPYGEGRLCINMLFCTLRPVPECHILRLVGLSGQRLEW